MPRRTMLAVLLAVSTAALPLPVSGQPTPEEIVRHVDELLRGESSRGRVAMDVVTARWRRTIEMDMWSLGRDYSLVRVRAPARDAGTATLKAGRDIWNYLPRVDRTIKIPSAGMGGSWMGSHFTYDDLVRESSLVDDYAIALGFEGERDGAELWEFVLTPRPEAPVVWSRVELEVRKRDRMPVRARYFDDRGRLARTMVFADFRTLGGRLVPTELSMHPEDKPGERTSLRYADLEFDLALDREFFSLRRLRESGER
jgi:hypothetical protein